MRKLKTVVEGERVRTLKELLDPVGTTENSLEMGKVHSIMHQEFDGTNEAMALLKENFWKLFAFHETRVIKESPGVISEVIDQFYQMVYGYDEPTHLLCGKGRTEWLGRVFFEGGEFWRKRRGGPFRLYGALVRDHPLVPEDCCFLMNEKYMRWSLWKGKRNGYNLHNLDPRMSSILIFEGERRG